MRPSRTVVILLLGSVLALTPICATSVSAGPRLQAQQRSAGVSPTCGGTSLAKSGGGTWTCTFDDEFSGSALDSSKWTAMQTANSGYRSGSECYFNASDTVSVSGGALHLTAHKVSPFTCSDPYQNYSTSYRSGMVTTAGKYTQTYGRFEVRAMLPASAVAGLQESFWLWPANSSKYGSTWPASGEMDIAEIYSKYNDRAVPYVHYNAAKADPNVTNTHCLIKNVAAFHSYVLEWTPQAITVTYDGTTCLRDVWNPAKPLTRPQPFDQPFEMSLTQALGIGSNAFTAKTPLPATTTVDYVRMWK